MLRIQRPKNLTEIAHAQLRTAIIEGHLAFGEPLSEISVAQAMGISGSPVRHALALLRVEGLVEVVPQRGTFVFTPDGRQLDDMAVLRTALEMAALEAAIHVDHAGLTFALDSV